MSREDVVRKVTALLRLAERGGTAEEAAVAAAKAQELMDKYEINQAALRLEGDSSADTDEEVTDFHGREGGELDTAGVRIEKWRWDLAGAVSRSNGCYLFGSSKCVDGKVQKTIEIVGRPSAVETTRYLYAWLFREAQRIADEKGKGMGQLWRREFKEGFAQEVGSRLRVQRKATVDAARAETNSSSALVLVNKAIAKVESNVVEAKEYACTKFSLRSRSGWGGNRPTSESARSAGRAAGAAVSLGARSRQIGGGK